MDRLRKGGFFKFMAKKAVVLHNKLVRDKVAQILEEQGVLPESEIIGDKVRLLRLLMDELELNAQDAALASDEELLEKLGDIESVIDGILKVKGLSRKELLDQQLSKDTLSGAFEDGVFLIQTVEIIKNGVEEIEEEEKDGDN